jgi:glycosyltransferase involved in cell wall biosynthesis
MRIAYITSGAGGMYCGSCLRDNTLAAQLIAAGHDVVLIPTYTPTRTDEVNVSSRRVFLGGINVYLEQNVPFLRRMPRALSHLLDWNPLLKLATLWKVRIDPAHLGSLTVSVLKGPAGNQSREIRDLARFLKNDLRPDIVMLPNSLLLGLAPAIREEVSAPICCTLQGEDLFLQGLSEPHRSEAVDLIRSYVPLVDRFIAVSNFCASSMAAYLHIPAAKIRVVRLGINLDGFHRSSESESHTFTVGYMARIAPEKGLDMLAEAYRRARDSNRLPAGRLWAAGYLAPEHKPYLARIRRNLEHAGLSSEFNYFGEVKREEKLQFLRSLHILSVPAAFDEPKGIYLLEAMASGVPVVQPDRGAFPEIINATQGGIIVARDDPETLAEGMHEMWRDTSKRHKLATNAYNGVRTHFTAEQMAQDAVGVFSELLDLEEKATGTGFNKAGRG